MSHVILNKITSNLLDDIVHENQCGFLCHHGLVDMIFAIRQIQERCQELKQCLYLLFMDLIKAFDTVSHTSLWQILCKLGCPPRIISNLRYFHDGMMVRVTINGDMSDVLPITNGVKKGCVQAPILFRLLFAAVLFDTLSQSDSGIKICYWTKSQMFDLWCL